MATSLGALFMKYRDVYLRLNVSFVVFFFVSITV